MTKTLLLIEASARDEAAGSVSRPAARRYAEARAAEIGAELVIRDVAADAVAGTLPVLNAGWVKATFTPPEERDDAARAVLARSDVYVAELQAADEIVIGTPIYNFSVPASLKLWIDQVARAGVTFRYTADGPEGLLKTERAHLVISSGGVALDSPADFATPYLRQYLGFLGITDVEAVSAASLSAAA